MLIHPFVNGNGRCTRLLADVVVKRLKAGRLTWGSAPLIEAGEARAACTRALRCSGNSSAHHLSTAPVTANMERP
ncbi:MAG: hypothetical protein ACAH24_21995 [Hyphomicrobiaceae bacterium]